VPEGDVAADSAKRSVREPLSHAERAEAAVRAGGDDYDDHITL
jgi:hypothetical protein